MKIRFLIPIRYHLTAGQLLLGLVIFLGASAGAQELLKNGNFESPFPVSDPTDGWAIVYPGGYDGGAADWAIAGATTEAARHVNPAGRGAHLRPNNSGNVHAYFKQVVTNLTEGASYTLTCLKMQAGFNNYVDDGKMAVFISLVSGSSSNVIVGNASSLAYTNTITCAASRQIEVQLHLWKAAMAAELANDLKHSKASGWWDDCSLTLTPP